MEYLYLLSVSMFGIKNIQKKVTLNFYKKTVDKNFDPGQYRVKAVYGENGAGKTALLSGISIYQHIVIDRSILSDITYQRYLLEMINKKSKEFRFDCEYLHFDSGNIEVYRYGFTLKNKNGEFELVSEKLEMKNGNSPQNKYSVIYEIENGEIVRSSFGTAEERIKGQVQNLLDRNSFLSLALFQKVDLKLDAGCARAISNSLDFPILMEIYFPSEDLHELYLIRKQLAEMNSETPSEAKLKLSALYASLQTGAGRKYVYKEFFAGYQKQIKKLTDFIRLFKRDLQSIDVEARENKDFYECELILNYGDYRINKEFESTGIKKLISLFDCFTVAAVGGVVFIDEMDANMNDVYLRKLVEYFMYFGKGQLCFTTHNIGPMEPLTDNKLSIEFLSDDNVLTTWTKRGNATPENCYRNGLIDSIPFNITAADFLGILGE